MAVEKHEHKGADSPRINWTSLNKDVPQVNTVPTNKALNGERLAFDDGSTQGEYVRINSVWRFLAAGVTTATQASYQSIGITPNVGAWTGGGNNILQNTGIAGQILIPNKIVATSCTYKVVNNTGTIDISIFSEDGQTRYFKEDKVISATGEQTFAFSSAITFEPGIYYAAITVSNNGLGIQTFEDRNGGVGGSPTGNLFPSGEPIITGHFVSSLLVSGSEMPLTFDPTTDLTAGAFQYALATPIIRLDS